MKELAKQYIPQECEDRIYAAWESSGAFKPNSSRSDQPFSVMMPPPNVTGILHLGHALENSILDTMVRFKRMQGYKTLLVPGTDHAAVATQAKVEKLLIEKGIKDPRKELGREKLLTEIRTYAEESKKTILTQIRKMGTSCDWDHLAYTFDEERTAAVNAVFTKMYNDGLIYRRYRVINWSVKGQSTCSDDELEYTERPGKLYTFKYAHDFPISIATTRPETKLGDTAVAVHPEDPRYKKYIGQKFTVDVGAVQPLLIKVIASPDVDPNFGTGALGVTPAHSPIDFDMYEKQKATGDPIDLIQVIDQHGKMTATAGTSYEGLSVHDARAQFVRWLKDNDLLEKEEDIIQNVGASDRFKDVVESLPMTQWFIDVNKIIPGRKKNLKQLMIDAVMIGHKADPTQKITITPHRFEKNYINWITNLRDWCISRQVWWGHRIPVWHCSCGTMIAASTQTGSCAACGNATLTQDPDTLDTWFSSGLWTFSTLGWPEETDDFKTFHPSNWMQMGHEILFFWMARMILMTTYTLDQIPFRDVYIHGILRDEHGNKFSKSAGNNINPLEISAQYGTDALRLSLLTGIAPGNDAKYYEEKVVSARNFVSKLWNISRFITTKFDTDPQRIDQYNGEMTAFDIMILCKTHDVIRDVTSDLSHYRFAQAIDRLMDFTWHDFADWYIEIAKFEENSETKKVILQTVLTDLLALWHPFIPFVTEEIWQHLYPAQPLITSQFPSVQTYERFLPDSDVHIATSATIIEVITDVRTLRQEHHIPPNKKITLIIHDDAKVPLLIQYKKILTNLRTGIANMQLFSDTSVSQTHSITHTTTKGITFTIPLEDIVDFAHEREKKVQEQIQLQKYIASLEKKLSVEAFITNAPAKIITQEKEKLHNAQKKLSEINDYLTEISSS